MVYNIAVPNTIGDLFTEDGIVSIAGIGLGALGGEFTGALFQSLTGTKGTMGTLVKFLGEVVAGAVSFFLSRRVGGTLADALVLAGISAPAMIVVDLFASLTKKSATHYAQISALNLQQMFKIPSFSDVSEPATITVAPQVVYSRTLESSANVGEVIYNTTLG